MQSKKKKKKSQLRPSNLVSVVGLKKINKDNGEKNAEKAKITPVVAFNPSFNAKRNVEKKQKEDQLQRRTNAYRSKHHVALYKSQGVGVISISCQLTGNSHGPSTLSGPVGHLLALSLGLNGIGLATVAATSFPWRAIVGRRTACVVRLTLHGALYMTDGALHLPRGILRWIRFDPRRSRCVRVAAGIRNRKRLAAVVCFLRETSTSNVTISLKNFLCRHF